MHPKDRAAFSPHQHGILRGSMLGRVWETWPSARWNTSGRHPGWTLEAEDGDWKGHGGHEEYGGHDYIPEKTMTRRGSEIGKTHCALISQSGHNLKSSGHITQPPCCSL